MERKQFLKTALLVNAAIIAKPLLAMAKGFVMDKFGIYVDIRPYAGKC